ncbi:MAG: LytTR family DNA-binding domain-containing protein [Gammaproteobacteria bacterium]|nr:LytTR family DNA-binding domain-containing protein [Gammaproteobacteria bacterium]
MLAKSAVVPLSALIVDDEALARDLLVSLVHRTPGLTLAAQCANGGEALRAVRAKNPDLVFLDIHMPVMDGITVAEKLAQSADPPYIVFVTAYDEFAIKAFELNALDYLVKPIEKKRFAAAAARAADAVRSSELLSLTQRLLQFSREARSGQATRQMTGKELTVRSGDALEQLTTDDILWVEAANQYAHIHTANKTYTVSESLSQYARRFDDPFFYRIHRSTLVNGSAIVRVRKMRNGTHLVRLVNGDELVVARSRASLVPSILRAARLAAARG